MDRELAVRLHDGHKQPDNNRWVSSRRKSDPAASERHDRRAAPIPGRKAACRLPPMQQRRTEAGENGFSWTRLRGEMIRASVGAELSSARVVNDEAPRTA